MRKLKFIAFACTAAFGASAHANVTSINCTDYIVTLSDSVAVQGEAQAASLREFEDVVCARTAEQVPSNEGFNSVPLYIESLGISTRVVFFVPESS